MLKLAGTLVVALIFAAAHAADKPASFGGTLKGSVLEVMDVSGYTYMRLKTKDGETWAATSTTPVKVGTEVTLENTTVMQNFESKTLNRKFPSIVFGSMPGTQVAPGSGNPHAGMSKQADVGEVKVDKAKGANARTVAEIVAKSAELKDKPVLVHAKVVKYNGGIMGKNWIHVRDGSGSANDGSNDLLVTTNEQANVGDVINIEGVVRTNKDFGSGYSYKVLIEEAKLKK